MSSPRYRYAHQQERKRWQPIVEAGRAFCTEPVCKMPSRFIPPGSKWHLSHAPDGVTYLGPSHARCNTAEAAVRGNRSRAARRRRWAL